MQVIRFFLISLHLYYLIIHQLKKSPAVSFLPFRALWTLYGKPYTQGSLKEITKKRIKSNIWNQVNMRNVTVEDGLH